MNTIPLWVVANLGKKVRLTKDFIGTCETYRAGWEGTLVSIQAPIDGWQRLCCTVALDPNDISYEENFSFDDIKPAAGCLGSFQMEQGLIHF
jgi:hypothetical protein